MILIPRGVIEYDEINYKLKIVLLKLIFWREEKLG